jgi:hypothetical protein
MQRNEDNSYAPLQKISPEDPAARDDGPRLIPLRERRRQPRLLEPDRRYLELADIAMRPKKQRK